MINNFLNNKKIRDLVEYFDCHEIYDFQCNDKENFTQKEKSIKKIKNKKIRDLVEYFDCHEIYDFQCNDKENFTQKEKSTNKKIEKSDSLVYHNFYNNYNKPLLGIDYIIYRNFFKM